MGKVPSLVLFSDGATAVSNVDEIKGFFAKSLEWCERTFYILWLGRDEEARIRVALTQAADWKGTVGRPGARGYDIPRVRDPAREINKRARSRFEIFLADRHCYRPLDNIEALNLFRVDVRRSASVVSVSITVMTPSVQVRDAFTSGSSLATPSPRPIT